MPIYEYHCEGCGSTFERLVPRPGEGSEADCPRCGGRGRKIPSRFAVSGGTGASAGEGCPARDTCGAPGGL
jgi:putative FmdB family regulatory protein